MIQKYMNVMGIGSPLCLESIELLSLYYNNFVFVIAQLASVEKRNEKSECDSSDGYDILLYILGFYFILFDVT